jgi:hypothetical protein
MTTTTQLEKRENCRGTLAITAFVKGTDEHQMMWKVSADLISLSRTGAGFYIDRKCSVGQLVSMLLPMPRHLRCYDQNQEKYRIWGLVQHCNHYTGEDGEVYHVGVAFVGKNAPSSYNRNPLQSYRISGMNQDGIWKIVEASSAFVTRRYPRYWVPLEVSLSALDTDENLIADEGVKTENISQSGAAMWTTLKVEVGDSVKFTCPAHNFSTLAVVRNRQAREYELPKLHLEFIDDRFPVLELNAPIEETPAN